MKVLGKYRFNLSILVLGMILVNSNLSPAAGSIIAMQLTLEGNVIGTLTEAEIKLGLPTIVGIGGYLNSFGNARQVDTKWKGVNLPLFMSSILGELNYNLSIVALDYSANLTRSEIEGGVRTTDEENTTLSIKAIPVIAYEQNDIPVSDNDGPLRLVFIGENNKSILTFGPLWVKNVIKLQVTLMEDIQFSLTKIDVPDLTSNTSEETDSKTTAGIPFGITILSLALVIPIVRKREKN